MLSPLSKPLFSASKSTKDIPTADPKDCQYQPSQGGKPSMTDPVDPLLMETIRNSKTNPKYSAFHNDDQAAYKAIKAVADANSCSVPTFDQVKYQRNLAALSESSKKTQGRFDKRA